MTGFRGLDCEKPVIDRRSTLPPIQSACEICGLASVVVGMLVNSAPAAVTNIVHDWNFDEGPDWHDRPFQSVGTNTVAFDSGGTAHATVLIFVLRPAPPVIVPGAIVASGNFNFQFTGPVGQHYRAEFTPVLPVIGAWQVLTDVFLLPFSPFPISDHATNTLRFYRVISVP